MEAGFLSHYPSVSYQHYMDNDSDTDIVWT